MYSRYNHAEKPLRVPEHYSGCAFPPYRPEEMRTTTLEVAKPTPPPVPKEPTQAPPLDEPPQEAPTPSVENVASTEDAVQLLPAIKPQTDGEAKPPSLISFPDSDQLLLLGLILLLSGSGQDAQIVRWLGLLLLCG